MNFYMNTTYFKLSGESEYEEVSEEVSESKPVLFNWDSLHARQKNH